MASGEPRRLFAGEGEVDFAALLRDDKQLSLPPVSEWRRCSVPLALLLERYSLQVRRKRLRRGIVLYCLCLVGILAISFASTSSSSNMFTSSAVQVRVSSEGSFAIETEWLQPRHTQEAGNSSSSNASSNASSCQPEDVAADLATDVLLCFAAGDVSDVASHSSFIQNLVLFVLCQPQDPSGGQCSHIGRGDTLRSETVQGSGAADGASSCLPKQLLAQPAFADPGAARAVTCGDVALASRSPSFCFAGFTGAEPTQEELNTAWLAATQSRLAGRQATGSANCPVLPWGATGRCFLTASEEPALQVNMGYFDDAFAERVADANLLGSFSATVESDFEDPDFEFEYAWIDGNTRSSRFSTVLVNAQTRLVTVLTMDLQISLAGTVQTNVFVSSAYTLGLPQADSPRSLAVIALLVLLLLAGYTLFELVWPFVHMCQREQDLSVGMNHFLKYSLSRWDVFDAILLAAYIVLIVDLVRLGYFESPDALTQPFMEPCEVQALAQAVDRRSQLVGVILFLLMMRILKYMSLVPALALMWEIVVKGIYYFAPAFVLLGCLWLAFAYAANMTHHVWKTDFSSLYNSLVAVVIMFGDSGSAAWASLMQARSPAPVADLDGSGNEVTFFPLLFLYEFLIVMPFTAFSISAFYYAVMFNTAEFNARCRQEVAEKRASEAQATLNKIRAQDAGVESLTGLESRLNTVISDLDEEELAPLGGGPQAQAQPATSAARRPKTSIGQALASCWARARSGFRTCGSGLRQCLGLAGTAVDHAGAGDAATRQRMGASGGGGGGASSARRLKHKEALYKLQIYASRPENRFKVLISYDEIERAVKNVAHKDVLEIMALAGQGNVYPNSVKRRYDADILARRARGEKAEVPSASTIAEAEGRRRKVTLDDDETYVDGQEAGTGIKTITGQVQKLEENNAIGLSILVHEYGKVVSQQRQVITSLSESLSKLRSTRDRAYARS